MSPPKRERLPPTKRTPSRPISILRFAGAILAGLLGCAAAPGATDAESPNIELVKTLDAKGAFVSLEGRALFLTSGFNTNAQQTGYWFDIGENPGSPAPVSASLPAAWQMAVSDDHAFVCDYTKFLTVCEMRDREFRQVAKLPMPSQTENIIIRGAFAYIANHTAGLTIVDISSPSRPTIVGNLNPKIDCDAVALSGDTAILYGHWESRLVFADIRDPVNPRQVGVFQHDPTTFNQGEMAVDNDLAYCTAVNGLVIVNVADPANPKLASAVPLDVPTTDVAVMDGIAFVACRDGVRVYGVRDPALPVEMGHYPCPASQLAVRRAHADSGTGYHIYAANKRGPAMVLRFHRRE